MRSIRVRAGGARSDYRVHVGRGSLDDLGSRLADAVGAHRYVVIADENVAGLYADRVLDGLARAGLRADLRTFPAGEERKNRATWRRLTDQLLELGLGRDGAVVALGGGVTGDLAGFVAATFMRGIPVIQVPTSLVAMIDASVGGKTGVDADAGKNLVGAFHPPRFVLADPDVVRTLPVDERAQGLAEAVKHGAILDRAYLESLARNAEALMDAEVGALEEAVIRSVELKARVVSDDEREAGKREILNFGHTLGHAAEAALGYAWPHGSAVSAGMVLESRLGEALGVTEPGTSERLEEVLERFGLPVALPPGLEPDEVLAFCRSDKKVRGGRNRFVLLEEPGRVARAGAWSREVPEASLRRVLETGASPPPGRPNRGSEEPERGR